MKSTSKDELNMEPPNVGSTSKIGKPLQQELRRLHKAVEAALTAAEDRPVTGVEQFDRAWDAILQCSELKRARSRLSIHELRLIIRAAITGKTDR